MADGAGAPDRRTLRIFLHSGFVWQLCWSSYWTLFFLRIVIDVGLDPLQLLLLGTAKEITILLVEIPTGVVADIRSRRLSVILAFLICGFAIVGAGVATSFAMLVGTQVLWAFGSTFRSGAEVAWFTDEVGSLDVVDAVLPRRGRFEAVGSIVGLTATALLATATNLSIALLAVGIVLIGWGIVLIFRMPETGFQRQEASARSRIRQLLGEGFQAAHRPGLRVLLVVTVVTGFASEAVDRLSVARLAQIGFEGTINPALLVGGASVVQSLGVIVLLLIFGRRLAGPKLVTAMVVLNASTAIGVGLLAQSGLLAIALAGMVAQGTARSIARTVTVGWTNHFTDRSNRATVHSFVGQAQSLGEISGGIVLGVVAQRVGISAALTASAVIYFLASGWSSRGHTRWAKPAPVRSS
jgi:MFS family permease